jgi:hypothetical protein
MHWFTMTLESSMTIIFFSASEPLKDKAYIFASEFLISIFKCKNFDYPEKPLKYKHIRRISD